MVLAKLELSLSLQVAQGSGLVVRQGDRARTCNEQGDRLNHGCLLLAGTAVAWAVSPPCLGGAAWAKRVIYTTFEDQVQRMLALDTVA